MTINQPLVTKLKKGIEVCLNITTRNNRAQELFSTIRIAKEHTPTTESSGCESTKQVSRKLFRVGVFNNQNN